VRAHTKREVERRAGVPAKLELLLDSEHWPAERRRRWVDQRLQAQLRRARRTPYWRELVPPGACLEDVPPLDRDTLRRRYAELRRPDLTTPVWERTTSGSTGRPVKVAHGSETVGHAEAARLRQLTWFGLPPQNHAQVNAKVAAAAGDPPIWREPRDPPLFWINPYALNRTTVATVHRELLAAGGVRLAGGVSSVLARWVALYEETGLDGTELGVALGIVGGEMTYPAQRDVVRETLGCPVAEMYGSHELSLIALECEEGSLHVSEECVLVELLDEDGRRVPPGERGEVVVTLLHNTEMPLLRYRLGDMASWASGPCRCGRTLARLDLEIGRLEEMVRAPDGRMLHPRFLRSIYERSFGLELRAFHTVQEGALRFCVQLDLDAEIDPGVEERLEHEIARYLDGPVSVRIERLVPSLRAGKLRTFTRL
jgi:phenylacetate-CoA ligase